MHDCFGFSTATARLPLQRRRIPRVWWLRNDNWLERREAPEMPADQTLCNSLVMSKSLKEYAYLSFKDIPHLFPRRIRQMVNCCRATNLKAVRLAASTIDEAR